MAFLEKLSNKIGNDLMHSGIVKEDDAEVYIFGINQLLSVVFNVFTSLIIGLLFGVFFEVAAFMGAYIPLRSFAGGYHARTPLRCYIFSVIMLIIVSIGMKYLYMASWVYCVILAAATLVILVLSPVEDKNKPLDDLEYKVYKRRTIIIAAIELFISVVLKVIGLDSLFIAVVYSFAVLGFMLVTGKIKNRFGSGNK